MSEKDAANEIIFHQCYLRKWKPSHLGIPVNCSFREMFAESKALLLWVIICSRGHLCCLLL